MILGMRRILVVVALFVGFALGAATLSFAGARDRVAELLFGTRLMRAEVVLTDGTDYLVDHGRITAAGGGSVTLTEADGRTVTVALSPATQITLNGIPVGQRRLRRGVQALVVHSGNGPALIVQAGRR
jgi:hypothetical protein